MIEAMKTALEALESAKNNHGKLLLSDPPQDAWKFHRVDDAVSASITALRQAIEQAEKAQPVAWMYVNKDGECEQIEYGPVPDDPGVTPLYTAPPKKEWVGLTDEEIETIANDFEEGYVFLYRSFARAIEAAHGIGDAA